MDDPVAFWSQKHPYKELEDRWFENYKDYVVFTPNEVIKYTTPQEIMIYEKLKEFGVTPEIISVNGNTLTMKRYPYCLSLLVESKEISIEQASDLIKKYVFPHIQVLDEHYILHRDLNLRNIVCNKDLTDLRIIDFHNAIIVNELYPELLFELEQHFNEAQIEYSLWTFKYPWVHDTIRKL